MGIIVSFIVIGYHQNNRDLLLWLHMMSSYVASTRTSDSSDGNVNNISKHEKISIYIDHALYLNLIDNNRVVSDWVYNSLFGFSCTYGILSG